jgi:hypothetical protein
MGSWNLPQLQPLPATRLASQLKSSLVNIPAPGTEQDDHNPQRIQLRNLSSTAETLPPLYVSGAGEPA